MLKYETRTHRPLVKQIAYDFGRNHQSLYELDRQFAIQEEKLKGRDLELYDRDIKYQKLKEEQKKEWLIKAAAIASKQLELPFSFKLSFNKFNGYKVEYNGKVFETYNYLFDDYIQNLLNYTIMSKRGSGKTGKIFFN